MSGRPAVRATDRSPFAARLARLGAVALWLAAAEDAAAQGGGRGGPHPVARVDVIAARATAVQGALGVTLPLGNYVRLDAVAGAGVERSAGTSRGSARGDLVARFLLDPFRQARWSAYGGAGVSGMRTEEDWRGYLLAVIGVEGPAVRRLLPALELGLGGGARIGIVLRGAAPGQR